MLKMKSHLVVEVNEKEFSFVCDPSSSIPDALEANNQINAFLLGRIEQGKRQAEAQAKAQEEVKVEEESPKSE